MPGSTQARKQATAAVVFVSWLILVVVSFWWLQLRHIGNFEDYLASFNGAQLQHVSVLPGKDQNALVVHFVDPDCPCSRFSNGHIKDLQNRFESLVDFKHWPDIKRWPASVDIPVTPAVAIWTKNGELAYFGPYSGGAVCGQGEDFVAKTLAWVLAGHNPKWVNQDTVGCFCSWTNTDRAQEPELPRDSLWELAQQTNTPD